MANIVLPKVRLFIPCIAVEIEPGQLPTIYGPLHTIRMPPGVSKNFMLDELWFYVVLTDGVGEFRLRVELHGDEQTVIRTTAPQRQMFQGGLQLSARELGIRMFPVPFPRPGLYEFRLIANHAHLEDGGTAIIRVLAG